MKTYALGVEDHYAWANLVSVAVSPGGIVVLDRRRVELLDAGLPEAPYHHDTLHMDPAAAEELVATVRASAFRHARAAWSAVLDALAPARCRAMAIRIPPLPALPATVAQVHASTNVTNRADGMLYHQALVDAATQHNIGVVEFDKAVVMGAAAKALGVTGAALQRDLKALGKTLGPPWRTGHMQACAGAVVALRSR